MSRSPHRLSDYLGHILDAIERIHRYTGNMSESSFLEDSLIQDAVIRNLEVIGEASRNIAKDSPEFVARHPEIPLLAAYILDWLPSKRWSLRRLRA